MPIKFKHLLVLLCLILVIGLPYLVKLNPDFVFILEEIIGAILLVLSFIFFKPFIKRTALKINQRFSWTENTINRLFSAVGLTIAFSIILTIVMVIISWIYYQSYGVPEYYQIKQQLLEVHQKQSPLGAKDPRFIIEDFSISSYILPFFGWIMFLFTALFVLEEYSIYNQLEQEKKILKEQEAKELALSKVYALQHQLNPHFMFNTLNVLSGLMHEDLQKADRFIKKLSEIYRYMLEQSEEIASTLDQELKFAEAYIYLLKIRFEDKVQIKFEIDKNKLDWFLPSLTLELLIENAIKHNSLETDNRLEIQIFTMDKSLIVQNNILPRLGKLKSTGIGIKNLQKRLAALGINNATFKALNKKYIATIPLINPLV